MIIVSQDGKTILNFVQVSKMYVGCRFDGVPRICAVTSDGGYETMGNYTTELRGKEVIKDIVDSYSGFIASATNYRYGTAEVTRSYAFYRMPEV